jgi:hypothetical protein
MLFIAFLILAACPSGDQQTDTGTKPVEPPKVFRKRVNSGVRQALSECRNKTWHVIEFELNGATKTEIDDQDTGIPCDQKRPDITARYARTTRDEPPCASPIAIEVVDLPGCVNGMKATIRYRVVKCADESIRVELRVLSSTPLDPAERCE